MDTVNLEKIQELLLNNQPICISLYMPTHMVGREQQQDPIRLKNLLSDAWSELEKAGLRHPDIKNLLAPAEELQNDESFWQHQSQGLVIFLSDRFFEKYRLPINFEELVVVADGFHIKPLLPLVSGDEQFYLLALSQNEIRLLHGDRFSINEVDLENTPASLQEALWFDDPERQLQYHTGTTTPSGSRAERTSIFHGHGAPEEDNKTEILRYFQKVNSGINDLLQDEGAPLILAGVDYLLPIYHEANDYPFLVEEAITGNPEERSAQELHLDGWELVKPIFEQELYTLIDRYQELTGSDSNLTSNKIDEIVPAAHHGRVDILFVTLDVQEWGVYDQENATVERNQEFRPGDNDLLDQAAIQTILNGGKVYALQADRMPEKTAAAIFRFTY